MHGCHPCDTRVILERVAGSNPALGAKEPTNHTSAYVLSTKEHRTLVALNASPFCLPNRIFLSTNPFLPATFSFSITHLFKNKHAFLDPRGGRFSRAPPFTKTRSSTGSGQGLTQATHPSRTRTVTWSPELIHHRRKSCSPASPASSARAT